MNIKNILHTLEFNQIQKILSEFCHTYIGKNFASQLIPCFQKNDVSQKLAETDEAIRLLAKNSSPSFSNIANITVSLKMLEQGSFLSLKNLLELAKIFKLSQELKSYFQQDYIVKSNYPILSHYFSCLYSNKGIIDKIFSSVLDEDTLEDTASLTLQSIRKKQKNLEQNIRFRLNEMIHSNKYTKYIQENIITIKNDRFVIPVKEEYRSQIKGFVHDVSNAGSTLFIEPINIFELNNEINQLKLKEELEIDKILRDLSNLFLPYLTELELDSKTIGILDFIFAKAMYAKSIEAIIPKLNSQMEFNLKNARHPLISPNTVVPITLSLGKGFSTLLITGPNTGGKTVTLKTVGLLMCMAFSGLAIPVDETSSIYVFDNIFVDIGDNQSISDSLSTFSSHLLTIIDIINHASSHSLILVDELGSGTDPSEGANLAISILENFHQKRCLTIATTHYTELKKYALITDGFENASVSFNLDTLSPTYHLLIGVPGKSNAFDISKRLGLSESIIEKAKNRMSSQEIHIEDLLKNIYDNQEKIEKEKEKISAFLGEISTLKNRLQQKEFNLQQQQEDILNVAKKNAKKILLDTKEKVTTILKEAQNASSRKSIEILRSNLNEDLKKLSPTSFISSSKSIPSDEISLNDLVFIPSLHQTGTVLSLPSKSQQVQLQIGNIKMTLPLSSLEKVSSHVQPSSQSSVSSKEYTNISKSREIKTEINVIGYNVENAIFVIDKFLDDCSLAKLQTVRIIHGKGTGKLRNGIHSFLKTNPHVSNYRLGTFGEGEMGVTVVTLLP